MTQDAHKETRGLRVALVHSFYSSRNPSGENVAVQQQADALRRAGCEVELYARSTDDLETDRLYPLRAAWNVATGRGPRPDLATFAPDIVHVHNLFPNFGTSWIPKSGCPVVASLHNYRPLCAAGIFFRDGHTCTECLEQGSSRPGVRHGCYRNTAATIPVALGQRFDKSSPRIAADALISLTGQMRGFYEASGVESERIHVLPNFLPLDLDQGEGAGGGNYWLYVGRLSEEKGIREVASKWPAEAKELLVVGSGEQEGELRGLSRQNVRLMGPLSRPELLELMRGAIGLIFPSKCFEGFPMVYAEALACGTPVMTWEPTVVAALVSSDNTGIVGGSGSLADSLALAERQFPDLRAHCRNVFDRQYSEDVLIARLLGIYQDVIAKSSSSAGS